MEKTIREYEKKFYMKLILADYTLGKTNSHQSFIKHPCYQIKNLEGFLDRIDEKGIFESDDGWRTEEYRLREVVYSDSNSEVTVSRDTFLKLGKPKRLVEKRTLSPE